MEIQKKLKFLHIVFLHYFLNVYMLDKFNILYKFNLAIHFKL